MYLHWALLQVETKNSPKNLPEPVGSWLLSELDLSRSNWQQGDVRLFSGINLPVFSLERRTDLRIKLEDCAIGLSLETA
jgi:hypothetical protein